MRRIPNLRHLKAFSVVAEVGSISAAASVVHLSQPAITQALSKLEDLLETQLLVRSRAGVLVTDAGRLFLNRSDRALAMLKTGCFGAVSSNPIQDRTKVRRFDHLITVSQLMALVGVSDAGSFALAARRLELSQPSVHRLSRDLEKSAGIVLFVRRSRGVGLTKAGKILSQSAKLAFSELEQGFQELDEQKRVGGGGARLTIGTLPLMRTQILPNAINRFTHQSPDIHIRIVDGPYDDLLFGLRHGSIDFLLGALREKIPFQDVQQSKLFSDRLGVFGRVDHPLTCKRQISRAELAQFPWVIARPGTPTRDYFDSYFDVQSDGGPKRVLESSSLVLIRGLLSGSDRLTMISSTQIVQEVNAGLVEQLAVELDDEERLIGITKRLDWLPTATQQRFIDTLAEVAGEAHVIN